MTRRWLKWMAGTGLAALIVWGCERGSGTWWVGRTDLEIVFIVIDGGSGKPIPGAHLEVKSVGELEQDAREENFVMIAGANGAARKECRNSRCAGADSLLGFPRSYIVYLPYWRYRALAVGFD